MSITVLQSIFLLFAMQIWYEVKFRPSVGFALSTLALLLLRVPLVVQNGAVLLGSLALKPLARGVHGNKWLPLFFVSILIVLLVPVVTDPEAMVLLGIYSEARVIGSAAMLESSTAVASSSEMNRSLFPLLYLLSETAALSAKVWGEFDSKSLRGVLALPWIFIVVPFFLLGLGWLLRVPPGVRRVHGVVSRLRQSRLIATPWSAVALFVASSVAISWVVGDTTRWRIPDMPMVASIALAGWSYSAAMWRRVILGLNVALIGFLAFGYLMGSLIFPLVGLLKAWAID
jgi:hypothetical protein